MHGSDLLSHPSPVDLVQVRTAVRERLDDAIRRLGEAAVDRSAIAAIFHDVIHPKGGPGGQNQPR
jgi:hypothetical protein